MWKIIAAIATILGILGYFSIEPEELGGLAHKLIIIIGTYVIPVFFVIYLLVWLFKFIGWIFGLGKEKGDEEQD